jgi:hypothetical protein
MLLDAAKPTQPSQTLATTQRSAASKPKSSSFHK